MDKKHIDEGEGEDEDKETRFKSKNLETERTRRKKLNDRQLQLRALVPIITNMTKPAIIIDATAYIQELKESVEELTNQLSQMEANRVDDDTIKLEEIDGQQEMKNLEVKPEVEVSNVSGTKLWIKAVFPKKRGALTKLMEAINALGFDLKETSITTSRGAVLFTTLVEGIDGGLVYSDQMNKYLFEIVRSI